MDKNKYARTGYWDAASQVAIFNFPIKTLQFYVPVHITEGYSSRLTWQTLENLQELRRENLKILNVILQALIQYAYQWNIHFEINSSEEFY